MSHVRVVSPVESLYLSSCRYANTHSLASATARQTMKYREEARDKVREYFNCTKDDSGNILNCVNWLLYSAVQLFSAAPGLPGPLPNSLKSCVVVGSSPHRIHGRDVVVQYAGPS